MTVQEKAKLQTPLRSIINENGLFNELLPFDEYHLVMAESDFREGIYEKPAIKTYFYRIPPFESPYIISAGLSSFLNKVDSFNFKNIVPYLKEKGYSSDFTDYISGRDKLKVKITALAENVPAFPGEPIIILETTLIDGRLLEGILLSEMNFASLCATKWHRIKNAAMNRPIMEFGRRRAQNSLKASLYSYMAGVDSTSNCEANNIFGIPSSGTMGHEFIQSYESEEKAFDKWLNFNPTRPCLLLDTLSTIESGLPNAIKMFKKHKENLQKLGVWNKISVRIDSGDLAYLGVVCYEKLKSELETEDITVVLSNDLDEYSLTSIFSQWSGAGKSFMIDRTAFGIGTKGVTAWGEPALGGVCKMSELDGRYIIKISNNIEKTTLPGNLRSALIADSQGQFVTTLVYFAGENVNEIDRFMHFFDNTKFILNDKSFTPILSRQAEVYFSDGVNGTFIGEFASGSLENIRKNSAKDIATMDWSYKRAVNPHIAKVSLSPKLFGMRMEMVRLKTMSEPKKF